MRAKCQYGGGGNAKKLLKNGLKNNNKNWENILRLEAAFRKLSSNFKCGDLHIHFPLKTTRNQNILKSNVIKNSK